MAASFPCRSQYLADRERQVCRRFACRIWYQLGMDLQHQANCHWKLGREARLFIGRLPRNRQRHIAGKLDLLK